MSLEYKGLKLINKNTGLIKRNGLKLMAMIHETAVQCILHAAQKDDKGVVCNDARPMDQLYKALPPGVRREGFKIWVEMFSPIRWNGDEQVGVAKETSKGYKPYNAVEADALPFWDASKENKVREIEPDVLLKMLIREAEKINSANAQGEIVNREGEVTARLKGNVVEMKDYAAKAVAALKAIEAPHAIVETTTKVPGAVSTAVQHVPATTNTNLPAVIEDLKSEVKQAA